MSIKINILLHWDSLDSRWEQFNKTKLAQAIKCPAGKAVIKWFLFENAEGKLCICDTQPRDIIGEIGFEPSGIREILGVKKLSREIRNSRSTLFSVNNYILSLQS